MIKRFYASILFALVFSQHSIGQSVTNTDVPVAPLPAVAFNGWTNAFKFRNAAVEMVIAPDVGRMVYLAPAGGANLLRLDENLMGHTPTGQATESWINYGGDWFWPVPQSRWADFNKKDWPPPPVLAEKPWTATAWKGADGSQNCLLSRTYGAPLHIKASRLFRLENGKPVITVRQRIERTKTSPIPVSLWNISQIARPDRVVMATESNSIFEGGLLVMNFDKPGEDVWSRCDRAAVLNAQAKGEYKLGSDSERGWIAAQRGASLLIERVVNAPSEAPYPDGGCVLECYINAGLGYAEIETLSPEKQLKTGDVLENSLCIRLAPVDAGLEDCALAAHIIRLLDEE